MVQKMYQSSRFNDKKLLFQKIKKISYFSRYMHARAYVRKWTLRSRIYIFYNIYGHF